jgi:two-component system, cell cycle sensor histidine kinase and response regulator CckA
MTSTRSPEHLHNTTQRIPAGFLSRLRSFLNFRKSSDGHGIEKEFSDLIMDSSRSMLTIINRDYVYERANRRFCITHSREISFIEGRTLEDIWGEENFRTNIKPAIDRCFNGEEVHYEACFETPSGSYRYYDVNFRPLVAENGKISRLVAETLDITELREAEKAIRQIERDFRKLETRLLQEQKLESLGSLAGGIAHDFNNILTTIYGYAEISIDEVDKESSLYENMNRIISAVAKARSLTSQMLTFSRQIEQEKIPVNIWQVINETTDFLRLSLPENIVLIDNTEDKGILVLADPTQLFRVFMNLFSNAVLAMEKDGGKLIVETEIVGGKSESRQVEIKVSDTGVGMDEAVLRRIFEPFYTTRSVGKGTGLGLSVVHGIVSELGGDIEVNSEKGAGTVFAVRLPVMGDEVPHVNFKETGRNLLFISENRHESGMLRQAIEKIGYKVFLAESPEEYLLKIGGGLPEPDLIVFVDEFDSFTLKDIQDHLTREVLNIPVLLITGSQDLILNESFLNSGFVRHFLLKPVSLMEVKHAIELILTGK